MFDDKDMGVARTTSPRVRPRDVLLVGAFVVWSVGRAATDAPAAEAPAPVELRPVAAPAVELAPAPVVELRRPLWRKSVRLALAGMAAALVVAAAGLAARPDDARAPLVAPEVAASEHALAVKQAEAARIKLLRHLELAGIAARRVGVQAPPKTRPKPLAMFVQPSDRAAALATYIEALGTDTILRGLDASKQGLEQKVLSDPRVDIYPAGRGDVTSGKVDARVLAIIEYLAQANGQVSVSCLISGHSLYVAGRPGVVSAHIYGRAVDISAVDGTSILGHQGPGSVTEKAIRQILALPESVEPLQVISLMTLGGPSFALADHYDHIHIGY
jgi:hypothetical protein